MQLLDTVDTDDLQFAYSHYVYHICWDGREVRVGTGGGRCRCLVVDEEWEVAAFEGLVT
jgi:hypothetical protein